MTPFNGDDDSKWVKSGKFAAQMFAEAGVKMDFYSVANHIE